MTSEQQSSTTPPEARDYFRTPPWLHLFLADRFGAFDVDLACTVQNRICERGITEDEDALSKRWRHYGQLGFCNPPYSNPLPWVEKVIESAADDFSTVMVLPTHRNQKWASLSQLATERIEFEGRVNFLTADGCKTAGNLGGTQVLYFRRGDLGSTRVVWLNVLELRARWDSNYTRRQRQRRAYAQAHVTPTN